MASKPPDHRDLKFHDQVAFTQLDTVPANVSLIAKCPSVYNQLNVGSCTANAGGGLAHYLMMLRKLTVFAPSRLALYYWERVLENSENQDAGASCRDSMKIMNLIGVADELLWAYDPTQFAVRPDRTIEDDAHKHKLGTYLSINQDLTHLKQCLAMGLPFIFGFAVYESFESDEVAKTGMVPLPGKDEEMLGGHAVLAVGYNSHDKYFWVRNSWGDQWGINGYFKMPFDYILNPDLADDFWMSESFDTTW